MKWIADRVAARYSDADKARVEERGTPLASGLIAGEAIVGIVLAVTFLAGLSSITRLLAGSDEFSFFPALGGWCALLAFASLAYVLIRIPTQRKP
jgi:hypothetical protein